MSIILALDASGKNAKNTCSKLLIPAEGGDKPTTHSLNKCILALDASGKQASVCIVNGNQILFEKELSEGFTHSQTLLPLVNEALIQTKLHIASINAFAVSAGPGSFTGLRIGMALVKGLAFTNNTPLITASTLKAYAAASGLTGHILCALNARRGEVYWAAFENSDAGLIRVHADAAGPAKDIPQIMGNWLKLAQVVGDGAEMCYNSYNYETKVQNSSASPAHSVSYGVASLAKKQLDSGNLQSAMDARCNYLRLSQAERVREEKLCVNP